jgi:hypothetical protein
VTTCTVTDVLNYLPRFFIIADFMAAIVHMKEESANIPEKAHSINWQSCEHIYQWKLIRDYLVGHYMPLAYTEASWGFGCALTIAIATTAILVGNTLAGAIRGHAYYWATNLPWLALFVCIAAYVSSFSMLIATGTIWVRQRSHLPCDERCSKFDIITKTMTLSSQCKTVQNCYMP